jgi:hypothetical protein
VSFTSQQHKSEHLIRPILLSLTSRIIAGNDSLCRNPFFLSFYSVPAVSAGMMPQSSGRRVRSFPQAASSSPWFFKLTLTRRTNNISVGGFYSETLSRPVDIITYQGNQCNRPQLLLKSLTTLTVDNSNTLIGLSKLFPLNHRFFFV